MVKYNTVFFLNLTYERQNCFYERQLKGSDLSALTKGQQGVVIASSAHHQVMAGPWLLPLSLHTRLPSRETITFSRWSVLPFLLQIDASWFFEIWI